MAFTAGLKSVILRQIGYMPAKVQRFSEKYWQTHPKKLGKTLRNTLISVSVIA